MLDYYQALQELLEPLQATQQTETIPLLESVNRILADDLDVQYDSPLFDNSAMDGYAVAGDVTQYTAWNIVDRIAAGEDGQAIQLNSGEAVRIFTGAPTPQNCTAVIPQEQTTVTDQILTVNAPISAGQHIRYQAEELKKNNVLLNARQRITPAMIGLVASQGYSQLTVFKPLRITVFSTGNELLEPSQPIAVGKIYDANRYLLLSWLQQSPHQITDGGILPDNQAKTEIALKNAANNADIIITSGGVSVGEEDHLRAAINQCGKLVQWKLAIKPGKPFAWGEIENAKVFMLPGNPVASLVTFQQLVIPALQILSGELVKAETAFRLKAQAKFSITKIQSRREFIRVQLDTDDTGCWVKKLANQGSAMLATCSDAHALAEIPPQTVVKEGDLLTIYPLFYKV